MYTPRTDTSEITSAVVRAGAAVLTFAVLTALPLLAQAAVGIC